MGMKSDDENQNIEWKWSWNDEYLKWLCGYANVKGGTLYIGVNDDGYVVGLENARLLLEQLPNKIITKLGIVAQVKKEAVVGLGHNIRYTDDIPEQISKALVNRYACGEFDSQNVAEKLSEASLQEIEKIKKALFRIESEARVHVNEDESVDYISITVDQYPFAISCEGKYYKRPGSTLQLLDGFELQNFLLEKAGKTWDAMPVPGASIEDLDKSAIDSFRKKAVANKRMTEAEVNVSDELLLKNLKMFEEGKLSRAAILLFHPDPEQYIAGAYIKIAYFAPEGMYGENKYADIIYHDDIHGPLITQVDKAEELIFQKYFKALISYDNLQRIETFMITRKMFRELLLNPINHKDYSRGVPIQISVYDDHIEIYNTGKWPKELPLDEALYEKHESLPSNPRMADVFYKSGEIESWGTGFLKIKGECDSIHAPYPTITATESGVKTNAKACEQYLTLYNDTIGKRAGIEIGSSTSKSGTEETGVSESHKKAYENMLRICSERLSYKEKNRLLPIVQYFETHEVIDSKGAQSLTGKGKTTAVGYLNRLCELEVIIKDDISVSTIYKLKIE